MSENTINTLPDWTSLVQSKVESLRFGSVHITVHGGKVVQIERIERTRLDVPRSSAALDGETDSTT